jgi:DnaJ-domain-containing protein 1
MSIGRRLIDLARAELNSLLERAGRADDGDQVSDDDGYGTAGIDALSDQELEAELERRRRARQQAEAAARARARSGHAGGGGSGGGSGGSGTRSSAGRRPDLDQTAVRRAYASLEVPQGSDFETVRRAYRTLMRKYHPDLHAGTPEKQRAANELTQRLTDAYKLLEKKLRK